MCGIRMTATTAVNRSTRWGPGTDLIFRYAKLGHIFYFPYPYINLYIFNDGRQIITQQSTVARCL